MKNNIKKFLLKKHSADSVYLSLAVSAIIFVVFVVALLFTYLFGILCMNTADNIDLVMTTYCKRMESQGCLTQSEVEEMKEDLSEFGLMDIQVSGPGTDGTPIAYGEKVSIVVTGDIDYVQSTQMGDIKNTVQGLRDFTGNQELGRFSGRTMTKSGTSKH